MQSKIKQVTLLDGKQIFYPSEDEVSKLYDNIKEVIIEEMLTKAEYELRLAQDAVLIDALAGGIGITRIDPLEFYRKYEKN